MRSWFREQARVARRNAQVVFGSNVERPVAFVRARVAGTMLLATVGFLVPSLGPHRFMFGAILGLVFVPGIIASQRFLNDPFRDQSQAMIDVLGIVTLINLVPGAWFAATVVGAGTVAAGAFVLTAKQEVSITVILVGGLAIAARVHNIANWELPLLAILSVAGPSRQYANWYQVRYLNAAKRVEVLLNSADALLWEVELAPFKAVSIHGRSLEVTGYDSGELAEKFVESIHRDDVKKSLLIGKDSDVIESTLRIQTPSGSYRYLRHLGHVKRNGESQVALGVSFDVTELEESKVALKRLAETDALTGLGNRAALASFIGSVEGDPTDKLGFLLLDFDGFKVVNDTLGHEMGDRLITIMGERLREMSRLRSSEFIAVFRLGGDEFGLLCIDDVTAAVSFETAVTEYAHQVRDRLAELVVMDGNPLRISASVGVAFGTRADPIPSLMRNADIAMYAAKRARTGVEVFTSVPSGLTAERLQLQADLTSGLESEISLWFQPVIDTESGCVVSVEGLARWNHPALGLLPPRVFLDLIDASRLSDRFDRRVLTCAALQAAEFNRTHQNISVAVNLSATSIWSESLMTFLAELIEEHQLACGSLIVEISERDLLDDHGHILPGLYRLRELGVGLSLDDYGTGYSSLIRLRELPLTELKIDRSFVSGIVNNEVDRAIVRSTIDLVRSLGMTTVAEGVETAETLELLKEWGCDRIQGFLYSPAINPSLLDGYLQTMGGTLVDQ